MTNKLAFTLMFILSVVLVNLPAEAESRNAGKESTMSLEKFDIELFNKNADKSGTWRFVRPDGAWIRRIETNNTYEEKITPEKSCITYENTYDKQGRLLYKNQSFYGQVVGDILSFDENGKLIDRENHDQPFEFGIDVLTKLMREKFGIDLCDHRQIFGVRRTVIPEDNHPYYEIYVKNSEGGVFEGYLIDGITGEFLYKTAVDHNRGEGFSTTPYKAYMQSKGIGIE